MKCGDFLEEGLYRMELRLKRVVTAAIIPVVMCLFIRVTGVRDHWTVGCRCEISTVLKNGDRFSSHFYSVCFSRYGLDR